MSKSSFEAKIPVFSLSGVLPASDLGRESSQHRRDDWISLDLKLTLDQSSASISLLLHFRSHR